MDCCMNSWGSFRPRGRVYILNLAHSCCRHEIVNISISWMDGPTATRILPEISQVSQSKWTVNAPTNLEVAIYGCRGENVTIRGLKDSTTAARHATTTRIKINSLHRVA